MDLMKSVRAIEIMDIIPERWLDVAKSSLAESN